MSSFAKEISLVCHSKRNLNGTKLTNSLAKISDRLVTEGRSKKGWKVKQLECVKTDIPEVEGVECEHKYKYDVKYVVYLQSKRTRKDELVAEEWDHIMSMLTRHLKHNKWTLGAVVDTEVPECVDPCPCDEDSCDKKAEAKVEVEVKVEETVKPEVTLLVEPTVASN